MRAIVRNSIIDHYRERKRRGDRENELIVEQWPDTSEPPDRESAGLAPELADALAALPEAQREAVTLLQVQGLSVAEAALRTGNYPRCLEGSCASRLSAVVQGARRQS
jgi:DNA-directed RNA polymerase specialized sigma24 family protein